MLFTNCVSTGDNAIASIHLSVCFHSEITIFKNFYIVTEHMEQLLVKTWVKIVLIHRSGLSICRRMLVMRRHRNQGHPTHRPMSLTVVTTGSAASPAWQIRPLQTLTLLAPQWRLCLRNRNCRWRQPSRRRIVWLWDQCRHCLLMTPTRFHLCRLVHALYPAAAAW